MGTVRTVNKALGANFEMPRPGSKGKARTYGIFGIVAFGGIMIPSAVLVGYITYLLSNLLMYFGDRSYALISLIHIISAFTMIFCIPVMFNVLYFANDIPFMSALPIKPVHLFRAKFLHTFRTESFMSAFVILAMVVGWFKALVDNFGWKEALDPVTVIGSLLALVLIPVLPLIYCSVICVVLMRVMKGVKRISIFYHVSTVLFIAFAFVFLFSFRGQGGTNIEQYVDMLVKGENSFNDLCDVLFFTTPLVCRSISEGSIIKLAAAVLSTIALYGVMTVTAHFLYREGLFTAARLGGKKVRHRTASYKVRQKGVFMTLLRKEYLVLMRTMSYRTNCVYANLIWPVLSVVFFVLSDRNVNLIRFISLYRGGRPQSQIIVLICVMGLSFVAAGLNSIASTSFTREGAHIDLIKYIPVPMSRIICSKALINILMSYIPLIFSIGFAAYSLGSSIGITVMYLLVSLLCVITATIIGVCMDSIAPYTVWSDEATALRGNMNCFFNLAAGLVVAALICGGVYLLYYKTGNIPLCYSISGGLLMLLSIAGTVLGIKFVRRNIDNL